MATNRETEETLRINVGFMLRQTAGYSREVPFDSVGALVIEEACISNLCGRLCLTRTPQGILVQGELIASVATECVRCLAPFGLRFTMSFSDLFVFPASKDTDPVYVVDEGGFLDLRPIVREESIVAVPIQALCRPDCKGLCAECGENLNEGACRCRQDTIDPRLAPLRALLDGSDE